VAGYVVRNPLSLQRLVYLEQAVIYKGLKHNPTLGRNFESMDPPAVHEVVRVPVDEEGREIEAP